MNAKWQGYCNHAKVRMPSWKSKFVTLTAKFNGYHFEDGLMYIHVLFVYFRWENPTKISSVITTHFFNYWPSYTVWKFYRNKASQRHRVSLLYPHRLQIFSYYWREFLFLDLRNGRERIVPLSSFSSTTLQFEFDHMSHARKEQQSTSDKVLARRYHNICTPSSSSAPDSLPMKNGNSFTKWW